MVCCDRCFWFKLYSHTNVYGTFVYMYIIKHSWYLAKTSLTIVKLEKRLPCFSLMNAHQDSCGNSSVMYDPSWSGLTCMDPWYLWRLRSTFSKWPTFSRWMHQTRRALFYTRIKQISPNNCSVIMLKVAFTLFSNINRSDCSTHD